MLQHGDIITVDFTPSKNYSVKRTYKLVNEHPDLEGGEWCGQRYLRVPKGDNYAEQYDDACPLFRAVGFIPEIGKISVVRNHEFEGQIEFCTITEKEKATEFQLKGYEDSIYYAKKWKAELKEHEGQKWKVTTEGNYIVWENHSNYANMNEHEWMKDPNGGNNIRLTRGQSKRQIFNHIQWKKREKKRQRKIYEKKNKHLTIFFELNLDGIYDYLAPKRMKISDFNDLKKKFKFSFPVYVKYENEFGKLQMPLDKAMHDPKMHRYINKHILSKQQAKYKPKTVYLTAEDLLRNRKKLGLKTTEPGIRQDGIQPGSKFTKGLQKRKEALLKTITKPRLRYIQLVTGIDESIGKIYRRGIKHHYPITQPKKKTEEELKQGRINYYKSEIIRTEKQREARKKRKLRKKV